MDQIKKLEKAYKDRILTKKEYQKKLKTLQKISISSESFSWAKIRKGMFSILDPLEWAKTLRELGITDTRKWVVYALIISGIYGYGYLKGIKNKPVHFEMEGKEATIALNDHFLHILPDGTAQVENKKGEILKKIVVQDIPQLERALKPVGVDISPFFTTGYGISREGGNKAETGLGASLFKFYRIHLNTWLTNMGVYLGTDYKITDNFGVISGGGIGYEGDKRIYIGGKWSF